MPENSLSATIEGDRSFAVRTLLAAPVLDAGRDPDGFSAVVRQREWLVKWFDDTCGWALSIDVTGRFARLAKRSSTPDATRPAQRPRSASQPFDRRRYELLCLAGAELASHPVTTIGILAGALAAAGGRRLDTAKHRERQAFVDALQLLARLGIVRFEGGDVDSFVASAEGNAIVVVDLGRLHRLLSSAIAPSRLAADTTAGAVAGLVDEPRYGDPDLLEGEGRSRRARQALARRVLDDPVVHFDELCEDERAYVASSGGRRWLRDRVKEAGFVLEERAEGMVAVDPDRLATDIVFPAPSSNVKQVALVVVDFFVRDRFGVREVTPASRADVVRRVAELLDAHPAWARGYRSDPDGPARLAGAALAQLAELGLVQVDDEMVRPRPVIARYAAGPVDDGGLFNLKEDS